MGERHTDDAHAEIVALWEATFGEQPSISADAEMMLKILVSCLKDVGPWEVGAGRDL